SFLSDTMKLFILEVGRPIRSDAETQIGKPCDDILSVPRAISEIEIPSIAAQAYRIVQRLAQGGEEVAVVLSGPLALAFQLGQAIGMGHAKVTIYQFSNGRYVRVPPLTREHLFQSQ
ncbi:MAG: SAVED domain-containing protein, partial [Thermoprotei archaeon]